MPQLPESQHSVQYASGGRQSDQLWAMWMQQMSAVFDAAHAQARRGRPLRFGIASEPMQALAVGVADSSGKPLSTAFVPLPSAIELLEDLATMAEDHGYGETPRVWRVRFPEAWNAVRERREKTHP